MCTDKQSENQLLIKNWKIPHLKVKFLANGSPWVDYSLGAICQVYKLTPDVSVGFLIDFISVPVIAGFTSAAVLTIASGQVRSLLGITVPKGEET
jgi:sodium-independent sulfate anion transporter 11